MIRTTQVTVSLALGHCWLCNEALLLINGSVAEGQRYKIRKDDEGQLWITPHADHCASMQ